MHRLAGRQWLPVAGWAVTFEIWATGSNNVLFSSCSLLLACWHKVGRTRLNRYDIPLTSLEGCRPGHTGFLPNGTSTVDDFHKLPVSELATTIIVEAYPIWYSIFGCLICIWTHETKLPSYRILVPMWTIWHCTISWHLSGNLLWYTAPTSAPIQNLQVDRQSRLVPDLDIAITTADWKDLPMGGNSNIWPKTRKTQWAQSHQVFHISSPGYYYLSLWITIAPLPIAVSGFAVSVAPGKLS